MKVYIDILILINFICDMIILLSVSIILRRKVELKRLLISSFIGSISLITLFIYINRIVLFFLKLLLGIIMIIVCFKYKNFKYFLDNITYFLINSLILGGFLYFINNTLTIQNKFLSDKLFLNSFVLVIFSPLIVYIYIKKSLKLKNYYSLLYKVEIYVNKRIIRLNAYYDTGNGIKDPYRKRNIIIVDDKIFKNVNKNIFLVPCNTINGSLLLKCFVPDNVYIKGIGFKRNIIIGLSQHSLYLDGADCLLNKNILEDI